MKNVTKKRFTLVQLGNRGGGFYCKDTQTKLRKSLETKNRAEAERLLIHKNEAAVASKNINRKIGLVYLADSDPEMGKRTWRMVMDDIIKDKHGPTLVRERLKPASRERVKTSHFEELIALSAACAAQERDEPTQRELTTFNNGPGGARLVRPADCARTAD